MAFRSHAKRKFPDIQTGYELNSEGWFSAVIPTGRENILDNPSFEKSANGAVAVGGTIARSADFQSHGAISLKVTPTAGVNDGFYFDNTTHALKVLENTLYWHSFDFKADGGRKYKSYMARQFSGTQLGAAYPFTATGNPQRIEFPYREGDNTLVDSLTAYWKLGEATAATRLDSVGTNHLTPLGGANPGPSQTTGIINNAAQFTAANSEYLNVADTAALSVADVDFTLSCWVYLDSKAALRGIIAKGTGDSTATLEYRLLYNNATDRFNWLVSNGVTATTVVASALGSPTVATWYNIVCWHDSVNNVIGIRVNDSFQDTIAHTVGCQDGAGAFKIGTTGAVANFMSGRVDEVGFWKKVLSTAERTQLYNGGFGDTYNFLYRRLYVVKDNETNTRPFYVDGLQLEAGDFPTTLIVGDMKGLIPNFVDYYWTGAAHASTSVRVSNSADGGRVINLSRLGFRIISVLGLGMGGLNPVMTPLGNGGEFYQGTSITGRDFTLVGEIGNDQLSLDVARQALEDAFGPNRISPQQPIKLRYEPLDECGNSLGRTLEIPCVFKIGMELQRDNLERERLALTFRLYLPFAANDALDQGTPLSYQEAANSQFFIWRDENGNWNAETVNGTVEKVIQLPDGTLLLVGQFTDAGGDTNADYICKFDPVTRIFSAFNATPLAAGGGGGPPAVHDAILLPDNDTVIFVGNFINAGGNADADMVAKLTLSTGLFSAINATPLAQTVHVIVQTNDGNFAIGGRFDNAGGDANADRIAKVNAVTFAYSAFNATAIGAGGFIFDIKVESTGNLIAAGTVVNAGGIASADYVFRVNITTGAFESIFATPLNNQVSKVAIRLSGDLVIVGLFTDGNGDANADYAIGYNGVSFYTLAGPAPFNAQVNTATTLQDGTVALGGPFASIGSLSLYDGVTIHNGSAYIPFDIDFVAGSSISTISQVNNRMFISSDSNGFTTFADVTTVNNTGSENQIVSFYFKGPGRIVSLKNLKNGTAVYFNLTLVANEEAILRFSNSGTTFGSNLRPNLAGTILPGSVPFSLSPGSNPVSLFMTYTASEANDTNNVLSNYVLQGVTTLNSDNGRLYINFVPTGGGNTRADIYSDSARTQLVAQSATAIGAGTRNVTAQNGSGISGQITFTAGVTADSDIYIDVPVVNMSWQPAFNSISGAVLPRIP